MTGLRCPDCGRPLAGEPLACTGGHRFEEQDGVLVLLAAEFGRTLQAFAQAVAAARSSEGLTLADPALYRRLPFALQHDFQWRMRRYDLTLLRRRLVGGRRLAILDVGAWIGWLSHRLAELGHDVTAIDYFADPYDGLGARQFYPTTWRAIQMDLLELSVLDQTFDLIILNRCLQFQPDPVALLHSARGKLAPGGRLVALGLEIFADATVRARQVQALRQRQRQRFGSELFLRPTKGYLDAGDAGRLRAAGLALRPYRPLLLANMRAIVQPWRPRHYYGVCEVRP